jgi:hypothetical protein
LDAWFGSTGVEAGRRARLAMPEKKTGNGNCSEPVRMIGKENHPSSSKDDGEITGSFVEEKEYGVAFHYRKSDPDLAALRVRELASFW